MARLGLFIRNQRRDDVFPLVTGAGAPTGLTPVPIGGTLTIEGKDVSRPVGVHAIAWMSTITGRQEHLPFPGMTRESILSPAKLPIGGRGNGFCTTERPHTALGAEVDHGFLRKHNDCPELRCPRPSHARKCCRCCCQGHGFLAPLSHCADSSCTAY